MNEKITSCKNCGIGILDGYNFCWQCRPYQPKEKWGSVELEYYGEELSTQQILESFKSEKCFCGAKKKSKMSHCRKCYFRLPQQMRNELYLPFFGGYENAYNNSICYLKREGVKKAE